MLGRTICGVLCATAKFAQTTNLEVACAIKAGFKGNLTRSRGHCSEIVRRQLWRRRLESGGATFHQLQPAHFNDRLLARVLVQSSLIPTSNTKPDLIDALIPLPHRTASPT